MVILIEYLEQLQKLLNSSALSSRGKWCGLGLTEESLATLQTLQDRRPLPLLRDDVIRKSSKELCRSIRLRLNNCRNTLHNRTCPAIVPQNTAVTTLLLNRLVGWLRRWCRVAYRSIHLRDTTCTSVVTHTTAIPTPPHRRCRKCDL